MLGYETSDTGCTMRAFLQVRCIVCADILELELSSSVTVRYFSAAYFCICASKSVRCCRSPSVVRVPGNWKSNAGHLVEERKPPSMRCAIQSMSSCLIECRCCCTFFVTGPLILATAPRPPIKCIVHRYLASLVEFGPRSSEPASVGIAPSMPP